MEATLRDLDTEVMKSGFPFSLSAAFQLLFSCCWASKRVFSGGCSALLALLLGNRFVVAGVGDCRVLLLEGEGKGAGATRLLDCDGRLNDSEEQLRVWRSGGMAPWAKSSHGLAMALLCLMLCLMLCILSYWMAYFIINRQRSWTTPSASFVHPACALQLRVAAL